MNIGNIMDQLGTALSSISGLRVSPYHVDRISPPAAIVGWPDPITYDATLGRGSDTLMLPVFVLVGTIDQRTSRNLLATYLDGSGIKSVKAAIDNHTFTACHFARVSSARVEAMSVAGVDYLGAVFDVELTGSGTS